MIWPADMHPGALATILALATFGYAADTGSVSAQEQPSRPDGGGMEAVVGAWSGSLDVPGGGTLTIIFNLEVTSEGELSGTLDVPDQGAIGIPVSQVTFGGDELTLELSAIGARFQGTFHPPDSLRGEWEQGGMRAPLEMERTGESEGPARPQEPEAPFPYRSDEVRFSNSDAGIRLAGTLTLPEGEGPFPAVALVSGSGPQNRDSEVFGHRLFLVLADYLTRRGISVLRFDDRGVGASEGEFSEATTRDFAGDAAAAVSYLRDRPEVDPDAVGLVGMSEGGLVAPLAAVQGAGVSFLVLMAGPGLPGEDILYMQSELIARAGGAGDEEVRTNRRFQERLFRIVKQEADPDRRSERLRSAMRTVLTELTAEERLALGVPEAAEDGWISSQVQSMSSAWFRGFLMHDPRPVLERVRVPVLALNGELDLQVPPEENLAAVEEALAAGGNPDFTVRELLGLNHLFQTAETGSPAEYGQIEETMSPEAMEIVADWILDRAGYVGG